MRVLKFIGAFENKHIVVHLQVRFHFPYAGEGIGDYYGATGKELVVYGLSTPTVCLDDILRFPVVFSFFVDMIHVGFKVRHPEFFGEGAFPAAGQPTYYVEQFNCSFLKGFLIYVPK